MSNVTFLTKEDIVNSNGRMEAAIRSEVAVRVMRPFWESIAMSDTEEKNGIIVTLPLTCGTCSTLGREFYLRWCTCCGDAICPSCFPAGNVGLDRCRRCKDENRPTQAELAGRERARRFEEAILKSVTGS